MGTISLLARRAFLTSLAVLLMIPLASCQFGGWAPSNVCREFDELPLTGLTSEGRTVVFETQGAVIVMHGFGSATLASGAVIKVEQSLDIPAYANKATVFLNGWKAGYLGNDDHHVLGLGTLLGKIRLEGRKLTWNALGLLGDGDAEPGYDWTYHYTVIAWNDAALNVLVNHDDADNFCKAGTGGSDNFYFADNGGTTTALSAFSSFLQNPGFPPRGTVAILPRGFGIGWSYDHHLLQLAYNLDHSEEFAEYGKRYKKAFEDVPAPLPTPRSVADSGFVSWTTYSILKDNARRRGYTFGEMVSALGGNDVGLLQPPFSVLPHENIGGGCVPQGNAKTEELIIENIPFDYAIPMLTGWDLYYFCDDEHVKEIGVWIAEWHYDKDPAAPTGTLRYTLSSALRDKNSSPAHSRSHKVTILGLRRAGAAGATPTGRPAAVGPSSPSRPSDAPMLPSQRRQ